MLTSLGFDTLAIHVNRYNSSFDETLNFFYELGIKNFLFIFDYDPLNDSIAIIKSKMNELKNTYKKRSFRINIKSAINLHISQGAGFHENINQIYCNKKSNSLLVSLPLFIKDNYEPISLDINNLLYKKSTFLYFTSFEQIIESSNLEFCSKFINNPRIGLLIDANYLLNPQKHIIFNKILNSNTLILPCISKDISYYAGILASTNFAIEKYGKKDYFKLCSQINKASVKIFN
jgi:hypothetical protein